MNKQTILQNMSVAFLAQGVSMCLSILQTLLVPKVLGVEQYGYWQLYIFYISYVGFFHLGLSSGVYLTTGGQTREQMENVPDTYITKQWASDPELPYAKLVGDRWYLDPAYSEVRELIAEGVTEILENYDVDGIHIDDYFYPTTEESFDREAFERSGSRDLARWRRDNVTAMVKGIYDAVKAHDGRQVFGISPQGNIEADLDGQYADVRLWAGEKGYCDYILPQIYYGFRNESLPFEETLQAWEELRGDSGVGLIIGLAGYKEGKPDKWAGAGEQEWVEDSGVIERQIAAVKASGADGYAVYY